MRVRGSFPGERGEPLKHADARTVGRMLIEHTADSSSRLIVTDTAAVMHVTSLGVKHGRRRRAGQRLYRDSAETRLTAR